MDYVLITDALQKKYKDFTALNDISIHVPRGAIYGFVGQNGSGKTTFFRIICGLQAPTAGSYTLFGKPYTSKDIRKSRKRMGMLIERPGIYPSMTAEENLKTQYRILGLPSFEGIPELLSLVGLGNTGKKKAANFSLGMCQRLGIAIALAGNPDFLVLDEPTNGLDPQGIIETRELILKLNREQQVTVLISSHSLDELSRLATHYGFIHNGRLLEETSASDLKATYRQRICLSVTDMVPLCALLDNKGLAYKITSETHVEIYDSINITELVQALAAKGCSVLSIHEKESGLENHYMNLVGMTSPSQNQKHGKC